MTQLSLAAAPALPPVAGPVMFCGLNSSTATADRDDPTIAKLARYVRSWGVELVEPPVKYREGGAGSRRYLLTRPGMVMTNLFSNRSTDPRGLLSAEVQTHFDEAGDLHFLREAARRCPTIVCAWGGPYGPKALGELVGARAKRVEEVLLADGHTLHMLALSQGGIPRHCLYLKGNLRPSLWRSP